MISVFIRTNPFKNEEPLKGDIITLSLAEETDNTIVLVQRAIEGLEQIYVPCCSYKRAGVILSGLIDGKIRQPSLFSDREYLDKSRKLMQVLDRINMEHGGGTLFFGGAGVENVWKGKGDKKSPCYTTKWADLPVAKAV